MYMLAQENWLELYTMSMGLSIIYVHKKVILYVFLILAAITLNSAKTNKCHTDEKQPNFAVQGHISYIGQSKWNFSQISEAVILSFSSHL